MDQLYLAIGISIVVLTLIDFIWTTLWVDGGAGPLTNKLTSAYRTLHKQVSRNNSKFLSLAEPIILVSLWQHGFSC